MLELRYYQTLPVSTLSVRKLISKITKRAPRKGSRVAAPSLRYEDWLIEQLKNPAEAAAYLETVLEEGDQAAIMLALRQVSKSGNPELRSLTAVLKATGLRIAVKPVEKQAA
jgi:DNA-binding phage protein